MIIILYILILLALLYFNIQNCNKPTSNYKKHYDIVYDEFIKDIDSSYKDVFYNDLTEFMNANISTESLSKMNQQTYIELLNSLTIEELSKFRIFINKYVPSYLKAINSLDNFIHKSISILDFIENYKFKSSELTNPVQKIKNCMLINLHSQYSYTKISSILEFISSKIDTNNRLTFDDISIIDNLLDNILINCISKYPKIYIILILTSVYSIFDMSSSQNQKILLNILQYIDVGISNNTIDMQNNNYYLGGYRLTNFLNDLSKSDIEFQGFKTLLEKNNLCFPGQNKPTCIACVDDDFNI